MIYLIRSWLGGGPTEEKDDSTTQSGDPALSGTISISPNSNVTTDTELTATYSGSESRIGYQWNKDGEPIEDTSSEYTPTEAGSYTVAISAEGYPDKTSAPVTVTLQAFINIDNSTFYNTGYLSDNNLYPSTVTVTLHSLPDSTAFFWTLASSSSDEYNTTKNWLKECFDITSYDISEWSFEYVFQNRIPDTSCADGKPQTLRRYLLAHK